MDHFATLTRRREIGANSYLVELGGTRIVLDAGMHPKAEGREAIPRYDLLPYDSVDAIIITHSHLDHVGTLPVLQREQPRAFVYMTEPTGALVDAMLHNSVNVMTAKRMEHGIADFPLYSHREADQLSRVWEYRKVRQRFHIGDSDVECEFFDAGHILGSVGVMLYHEGRRIFYTGDVNFEDQTITKSAEFPDEPVDTLIVETTRGASPRRTDYTRQDEAERLAEGVRAAIERGGSVLIPVFAMGKTQEIIVMLEELRRRRRIPKARVHMGGLSTKMTTIFDKYSDKVRRNHKGLEILNDLDVEVSSRKKNRSVEYRPGEIYALSSGMMTEKTLSNQFAAHFLDNPKNALLIVGYCDPESPAGRILVTPRDERVTLDASHPSIPLRCDVQQFDFSGHATRESIRDFIARVRPEQLILVHGDEDAMEWFEEGAKEDLPGVEVVIPDVESKVSLDAAAVL
ncbi:MAG: MBL fold metallo-hydrolase [Verrucomicrobiota bacterium]